ncbi:predicted protein [Plenodomus lingam JN3]|uniref:Predicted protein n=1 Tax=Leptosphaeria maculans (strain JN3 / isolate v23.1.3 / race Av1-4-5-6-7-8) TaxID=985895 RepID=E4ZVJ0_LEPMJ|nr:predicted protein [Plenodomus lingam JN3]CBX95616.1 predicted protein [Plenodomus lingam JN3]
MVSSVQLSLGRLPWDMAMPAHESSHRSLPHHRLARALAHTHPLLAFPCLFWLFCLVVVDVGMGPRHQK